MRSRWFTSRSILACPCPRRVKSVCAADCSDKRRQESHAHAVSPPLQRNLPDVNRQGSAAHIRVPESVPGMPSGRSSRLLAKNFATRRILSCAPTASTKPMGWRTPAVKRQSMPGLRQSSLRSRQLSARMLRKSGRVSDVVHRLRRYVIFGQVFEFGRNDLTPDIAMARARPINRGSSIPR